MEISQCLGPSDGDVDGGDDDEIGVDMEPREGPHHHPRRHVELVVPGCSHVHHRRVRVPPPLRHRISTSGAIRSGPFSKSQQFPPGAAPPSPRLVGHTRTASKAGGTVEGSPEIAEES
ncbi:hypothetical protein BHE74_00029198 [Ensete ventricosum]|nr:hypothetical protein BHE74_00029198 [Ensete ventricosum]